MKKYKIVLLFLFAAFIYPQTDPQLSIVIEEDNPSYPTRPKVTLENSLIKVVIRTQTGGDAKNEGIETVIKEFYIKSKNDNIVNPNQYIDACTQRPAADTAYITYNTDEKKTVRLEYNFDTNNGIIDYSIFPNSPIIKVDYIQYEYAKNAYWANIVELFDLGKRKQRIYGQESFIRSLQYNPASYWNTYDSVYASDPLDGGSLNYNGHSIILYGGSSDESTYGFGRILPFYENNVKGGMRILKFLDWGIEPYISTGNNNMNRKPVTSYLYVWTTGQENAISFGQGIIDAALPVELLYFNADTSGTSVLLNWATATEHDNYLFYVKRKNVSISEENWSTVDTIYAESGSSSTTRYYTSIDSQLNKGTYMYHLEQMDINGDITFPSDTIQIEVGGYVDVENDLHFHNSFHLEQNYPNPFNPVTNIRYSIPSAQFVSLKVFNILGEEVASLVNEEKSAGIHEVKFNAASLNSGVYIYKIQTEEFYSVKKLLLLK